MKPIALAAALLLGSATAVRAACPPATGKDFSGQRLIDHNFTGQNLRGANFTNAVLDGAQFSNADLTGAIFPGASLRPSPKGPADFTGATLIRACFQDDTLVQTNLQFAKLACADFSRAILTEADFGPRQMFDPGPEKCGRAKFIGATLSVRQIPTTLWRFTDFTGARFTDLTSGFFKGVDMTGAILGAMKFGGFDFTKTTMVEVDLRGADLRGAKLDGVVAQKIMLDGADLRLATGSQPDFTGGVMNGVLAQNVQFPGAILVSARLRGSNFAGANLSGAMMQGAFLEAGDGFDPAELPGANLNGVNLDSAHLNSVDFRNARMIAAIITNVKITDTDFSDATMPSANFSGSRFEGVTFHGSLLENAIFVAATLERSRTTSKIVDLGCTQLGGATFRDLNKPPARAVTFIGAVMPDADECRKTGAPPPADFYCGTELAGQKDYGPTVLPVLDQDATCPNGDIAVCMDRQWLLLPNWTTTACGQPEKRWTPPPPTPPPPGKEVKVPDHAFKRCLSRQFFNADDAPIPTDFAATVQEINCPGAGIADPTGLEAFTGLRKLILTSNQLTDGEIFAKLKKLEILQVAQNQLSSLAIPIATLKSVIAANNKIRSVTGFESVDLQYLDLSHNDLTTLFLDSQPTLFYTDLSANQLTDIGDLTDRLPDLSYLYLERNKLTTIGSLAASKKLTYLSLGNNPGFRCETLMISKELLQASNCGK